MRAVDVIIKKRGFRTTPSEALTEAEIEFFVNEYVAGNIPDYQVSALLMAIYFNGMTPRETAILTESMLNSGKRYDLSEFSCICVDKHSTGGVGDKVSIPLAPIVASCGVKVPMMSGRALGTTGGTLDKLESITGYRTNLSEAEFKKQLAENNYAMIGQTKEIVPADKLLYALRDVTGTVESVPLITSSILSKKIAEGSDALVFDVKCGRGAFMKTEAEATELAKSLVSTGSEMGKKIVALITNMSEPLGKKVGNFLEIEESVDLLKGQAPSDITELTLSLASWMLVLGEKANSEKEGYKLACEAINSGRALDCFFKNVKAQGGNLDKLQTDLGKRRSVFTTVVTAEKDCFIESIDAMQIGMAGVFIGVGRNKTDDKVCGDAGVILNKIRGDFVKKGEPIMQVFGKDEKSLSVALPYLNKSITYTEKKPEPKKQILKIITKKDL
ncbi:MAG: thymidine phosphorylase [Treponemataceae bacterium]